MVSAIAEDMKKMTEDILVSSGDRLKAVGDLVKETHQTLEGFSTDRKHMASQQGKDLTGFAKGLGKDVGDMLNGFKKNHKQMSKDQAKNLADYMNDLVTGVGSILDGFQRDHGKMSKELKHDLGKYVKDLANETNQLRGEYSSDILHAKKAWQQMCTTLARTRTVGGVTPQSDTLKKASTVNRTTSTKVQAKKKPVQKNSKKKVVS